MGSLPNLHELAGGEEGAESAGEGAAGDHYRPGPALGRLCGTGVGVDTPALSQEEKTRILHRYSGHGRPARTCTNPPASQDAARHVYDDTTLEHMAAYSPISSRSTRLLNLQNSIGHGRRRDSLSSSIGATSVRRLLATVVRQGGGSSRSGLARTRRDLLRSLGLLCALNLLLTAAQLPHLALQASVSVWTAPTRSPLDINVGSLLLCLLYLVACPSTLAGPALVRHLGAGCVMRVGIVSSVVFYLAHLQPTVYALVPACCLMGAATGPLAAACAHQLMTVSGRLAGAPGDEDEEMRAMRRTCVVRRVARAVRASHDVGLIVGSVVSALVVVYAANGGGGGGFLASYLDDYPTTNGTAPFVSDSIVLSCVNSTSSKGMANCTDSPSDSAPYDYNAFLDEIFDTFEGARLCGSQACPSRYPLSANGSMEGAEGVGYRVLPRGAARALAATYAGACLAALALACAPPLDAGGGGRDPPEGLAGGLRALRDTFADPKLQMAAPLAVFVGLEQAFIYADFSKSYVVCTLGIHRLNLVFLSMGLLQSIAACTLSMLLRSIRRYYVVAVGLAFHACLIMVLMLWKPMEDDPALFYVISASWGVCNAIWEMLNFTLLTGLYADNWEAPFANSAFFRHAGLTAGFGLHGLLCNDTKLWALAAALAASVVPFAWLEARLEGQRRVRNITRL